MRIADILVTPALSIRELQTQSLHGFIPWQNVKIADVQEVTINLTRLQVMMCVIRQIVNARFSRR